MADRAGVRRFADVVVFRAGRIKLDGQPGLAGVCPEDGFRGRRPADIAHADQQNPARWTDRRHGLDLAAEALVVVEIQDVEPGHDIFALGSGRGRGLVLAEAFAAADGGGRALLMVGAEVI